MRSPREDTCHAYTLTDFRSSTLFNGATAVVVRLGVLDARGHSEYERPYADNVSAHGVRVNFGRAWHIGEQAEITTSDEESRTYGEVAYCDKVDEAHFSLVSNSRRARSCGAFSKGLTACKLLIGTARVWAKSCDHNIATSIWFRRFRPRNIERLRRTQYRYLGVKHRENC